MKNSMKKGFTLVELLVVMTILAVLSFLAVPQFVKMQKQANERTFESNHRMVMSAINMFAAANNATFPTQAEFNAPAGGGVNAKSVLDYVSGKTGDVTETLATGLGQTGAAFVYVVNADGTYTLTSTLDAAQCVDGTQNKVITYTAR